MSDPAKIERLASLQTRLLWFTDLLSRAMATGPSDQVVHVSVALRRISGTLNLVKQAQSTMMSDKPSVDELRQIVDNLQTSLETLQSVGRTDIPLGELRSMTEEVKALAA